MKVASAAPGAYHSPLQLPFESKLSQFCQILLENQKTNTLDLICLKFDQTRLYRNQYSILMSLSSWEKRARDNKFKEEDKKVVFGSHRNEQTKRFSGHQ